MVTLLESMPAILSLSLDGHVVHATTLLYGLSSTTAFHLPMSPILNARKDPIAQ